MTRPPIFDSKNREAPLGLVAPPPNDCWRLRRWLPSQSLRDYVRWFWMAEWDLTQHGPFETTTLPYPAANMVTENGATVLYGPTTRLFRRQLTGCDATFGVLFSPAGLSAFTNVAVKDLVDDQCRAREIFDSAKFDQLNTASQDPCPAIEIYEQVLGSHRPNATDPKLILVNTIVDSIATSRDLVTVNDVALVHHLTRRTLQRLFTNYVGVGVKTVIGRFRLQEIANLAITDDTIDWSALAARLGYSDQAHLIRDFEQTVGTSPARHQRNLSSKD